MTQLVQQKCEQETKTHKSNHPFPGLQVAPK